MTTAGTVKAIRGPRWTHKRFVDMLTDCYGPSARGRPIDIAAVAAHAGVSPATVRRWVHNADGAPSRVKAAVPPHRIAQLQTASEPVENRNRGQYEYALSAIDHIEQGRIIPPWREQGWLAEHTVAIVEIIGKPWLQIVVTKGDRRAIQVLKRRARILDTAVVPHRFHAVVLAHHVMDRQRKWRVHPAKSQLPFGRTQVWMADAPSVDLTHEVERIAKHQADAGRR